VLGALTRWRSAGRGRGGRLGRQCGYAAAAVGYVTRGRGPRTRPASGWDSLTPTELTVAQAIAEGLSNPQIAGSRIGP
jgi:DNA-binding NarL/FixJ family response regulator